MTTFTDVFDQYAAAEMDRSSNATADFGSRTGLSVMLDFTEDSSQILPGARHRSPKITITFLNDATNGITPDEFSEGAQVTVTPRAEQTARVFRMSKITKQSTSFITIEVH